MFWRLGPTPVLRTNFEVMRAHTRVFPWRNNLLRQPASVGGVRAMRAQNISYPNGGCVWRYGPRVVATPQSCVVLGAVLPRAARGLKKQPWGLELDEALGGQRHRAGAKNVGRESSSKKSESVLMHAHESKRSFG